jgi:hypothetical protein
MVFNDHIELVVFKFVSLAVDIKQVYEKKKKKYKKNKKKITLTTASF